MVTHNFLLEIYATPSRTVVLRLSSQSSLNFVKLWAGEDLNLHSLRNMVLNHARLPFRHPPWRRRGELNPRIAVLQTAALPLRHYAETI